MTSSPPTDRAKIITPTDAAWYFGVSLATLRSWVHRGERTKVKRYPGGYNFDELEAWVGELREARMVRTRRADDRGVA